jgi:hypothetical protein
MLEMLVKKSPEISNKYSCDCCDYYTSKIYDFKKHLSTVKHKKREMLVNASDLSPKVATCYTCNCGKIYKHDTSYYRHKKICNTIIKHDTINKEDIDNIDANLVLQLIKQNDEFKELLKEQNQILLDQNSHLISICKDKNNTHITNNTIGNINSHNKTFNLNVFLNETCKDAMNIMDFVESIKLQLSDLESVGKLGYIEGISNIIIKNLKAMDIHKRPVHCSDSKREVMYIKHDNKWEKENEDKNKLRQAIKQIAHKNTRLLPQYKEKYPDCDTKLSEQYNKLIIEAMGGLGNNTKENEDKIIHRIAREVTIDKNNP